MQLLRMNYYIKNLMSYSRLGKECVYSATPFSANHYWLTTLLRRCRRCVSCSSSCLLLPTSVYPCSIPSMPPKLVKLTVVSDLTCPYCYIGTSHDQLTLFYPLILSPGHKELNSAVAEVKKQNPDLTVEIEYRPFFLHPYIKDDEPVDKMPWFIAKFGQENAERMIQRTIARGKECGIDLCVMPE